MKLYRFNFPGIGEVISSVTFQHLYDCLRQQPDLEFMESTTLNFSSFRKLTILHREDFEAPSSEFCKDLMNCVFEHFCTGTFAWFAEVLLELESASLMDRPAQLDKAAILQLLAVIATLYDENSKPVLLYPVDSLV